MECLERARRAIDSAKYRLFIELAVRWRSLAVMLAAYYEGVVIHIRPDAN